MVGTTTFRPPGERRCMTRAPTVADRVLDVRELDGEPFDDIMTALDALPADETLLLVNSFEPVPLYAVIEARGFTHETVREADDEWRVAISHRG